MIKLRSSDGIEVLCSATGHRYLKYDLIMRLIVMAQFQLNDLLADQQHLI